MYQKAFQERAIPDISLTFYFLPRRFITADPNIPGRFQTKAQTS